MALDNEVETSNFSDRIKTVVVHALTVVGCRSSNVGLNAVLNCSVVARTKIRVRLIEPNYLERQTTSQNKN